MSESTTKSASTGFVRLANVAVLLFLLTSLVMPQGWVHRSLVNEALADPPPDPGWAFGDDFIEDTWAQTHAALFGSVEPGAAQRFVQ